MVGSLSPAPSSVGSAYDADPGESADNQDYPEDNVVEVPNVNDVLCGRGGSINSHRGNEQFRKLVEKRKRVYLTARFKREKRLIASSIVTDIRAMNPPGRFLARKGNKDTGHWYDIGDEKARDKTSQALRENAPSLRAEIETEINLQREEMSREEDSVMGSKRPPPVYPHPPGHGPPPPHPHGAAPGYPPSSASYAQQYYDYYYHYYGYGAPPPPPPPGYPPPGGPPPPTHGAPHPPQPSPPAHGYPPAPSPSQYWASQQPPSVTPSPAAAPAPAPPAPANRGDLYQQGSQEERVSLVAAGSPQSNRGNVTKNPNTAQLPPPCTPWPPVNNQEEEDRRLALALQQEENAKAFEDRNRRHGSDRRSSRSTAFCAPGYRPRLLNDNVHGADHNDYPYSTPTRKRPAMSASQYVPNTSSSRSRARPPPPAVHPSLSMPSRNSSEASMASSHVQSQQQQQQLELEVEPNTLTQEEMDRRLAMMLQDQDVHSYLMAKDEVSRRTSRSNAYIPSSSTPSAFGGLESIVPSSLMAWTRGAQVAPLPQNGRRAADSSSAMMMDHDGGGDRKPAAANNNTGVNNLMRHTLGQMSDDDDDDDHDDQAHSLSSLNSRGRGVRFKDDSDIMSLFGEGSTIIPPASSTGIFQRVRGAAPKDSDMNDVNYTPIALEETQIHQQRDDSSSQKRRQQQQQQPQNSNNELNSSLLSQVANHILGTFGSSWTDSESGPRRRHSGNTQVQTNQHRPNIQTVNSNINHLDHGEMETEMGQEVSMEVRDESSMPPPQPRGGMSSTAVVNHTPDMDWPSRVGCHSWIPDTIGASASAFFGRPDQDQLGNHHHADDNSLTRQNSYSRNDISPVNSLDMDFSHTSSPGSGGRRLRHGRVGGVGGGGGGNSSILNVFDQKHDDPNHDDLLANLGGSVLNQVPSWERSFRSHSPVSLGDVSDDEDVSLIRVNSHDVKDKFFPTHNNSKSNMGPPPNQDMMQHYHNQQQQQQQHQNMHQSLPVEHFARHSIHDNHHQLHQQQQQHLLQETHDMDMDWEGDHTGQ